MYGLGAIDWNAVKDALRNVGTGVWDAAKERAARELLARVQDRPEYRELEREVAAERLRQLMAKPSTWALLVGGLYVLRKL